MVQSTQQAFGCEIVSFKKCVHKNIFSPDNKPNKVRLPELAKSTKCSIKMRSVDTWTHLHFVSGVNFPQPPPSALLSHSALSPSPSPSASLVPSPSVPCSEVLDGNVPSALNKPEGGICVCCSQVCRRDGHPSENWIINRAGKKKISEQPQTTSEL